jgi:N,N-dimethylformamidase
VEVRSDRRLFTEVFYSIIAGFDAGRGELFIEQRVRLTRYNSRLGHVVPLDSDTSVTAQATVSVSDAEVPLVIAGVTQAVVGGRAWVTRNFNGKVDSPKVFRGAVPSEGRRLLHDGEVPASAELLAHWDFTRQIHPGGWTRGELPALR